MNSSRVCDCLVSVRTATVAAHAWLSFTSKSWTELLEHSLCMALTWCNLSRHWCCLVSFAANQKTSFAKQATLSEVAESWKCQVLFVCMYFSENKMKTFRASPQFFWGMFSLWSFIYTLPELHFWCTVAEMVSKTQHHFNAMWAGHGGWLGYIALLWWIIRRTLPT